MKNSITAFAASLFQFDELLKIYEKAKNEDPFFTFVKEQLALKSRWIGDPHLDQGLFVSNHPTGMAEAVLIVEELVRRGLRPKVLANSKLWKLEALRPYLIPVDPYETQNARRKNVSALKASLAHLNAGGSLLIFPSGEVSSFSMRHFCVEDRLWNENVRELSRRSQVSIVPLWVEARNSLFFYFWSVAFFSLRHLLFPRELFKFRGKTLTIIEGVSLTNPSSMGEVQKISFGLRGQLDSILTNTSLRPLQAPISDQIP